MDGEFQEADILWPDTPRDEAFLPFAASEPYEAISVSRCTPAFGLGSRFEESPFFLPPSAQSSSAGAIPDTDDDEEWQEADVLWPDTADEARRGGGCSLWSFRGGFGRVTRRVKPAAPRREGGWAPDDVSSSPIDIPAKVAARRRVGAALGRRL